MYSNIKKWIKENRGAAILLLLVVIFFFVYSYFYLATATGTSPKFNSPDEAANYFFIKNYVSERSLQVFEPLNFLAEGRVHPRSMMVVGGYLVPGSFLGLILLYGWLAKIFTLNVVFFLTPFFAGAAILCFYGILKNIFDKKIALWASFLLLVHPAFWYYASRGFFPNILFVSLLTIGFFFLLRANASERNYMGYILGGLFFGFAMTVRLSEIIWVGGLLFLLLIIYRKKISWLQISLFLFFAALTFFPIFYYNSTIYGDPLVTAYNLGGGDGAVVRSQWSSLGRFIFPFGLDVKNVLKNFSTYFVGMFWWLAVPFTVGLAWKIKKMIEGKLDQKQKIYLLAYCFVALWLFCYYGSWFFYDNPAKEASIGTSYVRYWLPIYVFSLPLAAFFLVKLVDFVRPKKRKIFSVVLCLIFILFGIKLTFFDKNDGLAYVKDSVKTYAEISRAVDSIIEPDAVLIVDRADKIFFPEHRVITPLRDDGTYALIPQLAKILPLYYYGLPLTEDEINYIYQNKIDQNIVQMEKVGDFGAEALYKLERK